MNTEAQLGQISFRLLSLPGYLKIVQMLLAAGADRSLETNVPPGFEYPPHSEEADSLPH